FEHSATGHALSLPDANSAHSWRRCADSASDARRGGASRRARGLTGPPVPSVKARVVARVPGLAESRRAQIPVRADLARRRAQVTPEVVDRRATPEPVAVVDAVD